MSTASTVCNADVQEQELYLRKTSFKKTERCGYALRAGIYDAVPVMPDKEDFFKIGFPDCSASHTKYADFGYFLILL